MRFFTYVLCGLALCFVSDTSHAQRFRHSSSSSSCSGGSCQLPTQAPVTWYYVPNYQPAPANFGIETTGVKAEPVQAARPVEVEAKPKAVPVQVEAQAPAQEREQNFGVEWEKIKQGSLDKRGTPISEAESMAFANGSHDYAKKVFRLVVIGTKEEREPVRLAYEKMQATEREAMVPWFVSADHWSLKDNETGNAMFETKGHPTVYLLAPDGACLHRQDDWTGDGDIDAIRKGMKKYDPKKDADLRKTPVIVPRPLRSMFGNISPAALLGCVGLAGGLFLFSRKR